MHGRFLGAHGPLPEIREWYPLLKTLAMGSVPRWAAVISVLIALLGLVLRYRRRELVRFETVALLVLRLWHFRLVVLQRAFAAWLRTQPDWQGIYEDDLAIILSKT